jgi:hypothetical protein
MAQIADKTGIVTFFGSFIPVAIRKSSNDFFITVKDSDVGRLDLLAYNHYGTPALWWVIALANDIFDPLYEPEPGTLLRIPQNPLLEQSLSEIT